MLLKVIKYFTTHSLFILKGVLNKRTTLNLNAILTELRHHNQGGKLCIEHCLYNQ